MSPQQRKWLDLIRLASTPARGSVGEREDLVPPRHVREFERAGYVNRVIPHNSSYKERLIITEAGREALAATGN